jgi:hypothetical protein
MARCQGSLQAFAAGNAVAWYLETSIYQYLTTSTCITTKKVNKELDKTIQDWYIHVNQVGEHC